MRERSFWTNNCASKRNVGPQRPAGHDAGVSALRKPADWSRPLPRCPGVVSGCTVKAAPARSPILNRFPRIFAQVVGYTALDQFRHPKVRAKENQMRRWEYRTLVRNAYCDIAEELNTLGDDGWELVSIYASGRGGQVLVLKRPRAELKQIAA